MELAAYAAIAAGTISGGWRIIRTMGTRITQLRPVSGFAAETGAAVALFGSTALGAPVSTTHTVAGAIAGAGSQNRAATVNWSIFGRVAGVAGDHAGRDHEVPLTSPQPDPDRVRAVAREVDQPL